MSQLETRHHFFILFFSQSGCIPKMACPLSALITAAKSASDVDGSIIRVCSGLMTIVSDSSNVERHFLITAELRDAVMNLARAAVSSVPLDEKSVSAVAQLIALMMPLCIYWGETRSLFDTSEWRDILLQMMMAATMATRRF